MSEARQLVAQDFEEAAHELELAAQHLRVGAAHFVQREVPRGCAHAFAAQGHIAAATELVTSAARFHAARAAHPDGSGHL